MKKLITTLLLGAFLASAAIGVTGCKDDTSKTTTTKDKTGTTTTTDKKDTK